MPFKLMMIVRPQILLIPSSECAIHLCKSLFLHPFRSQRCQTMYLSFHSFCSLFLSLQDPGDFSKSILETPKCTLLKKKCIHAFSGWTHRVWEGFSLNISRRYTWLLKLWYQSSAKTCVQTILFKYHVCTFFLVKQCFYASSLTILSSH